MTQKEIEKKIQTKFDEWLNKPFATEIMPDWFYKEFQALFMITNQAMVKFRAETVVAIWRCLDAKEYEKISVIGIEFMATLWLSVPPINIDKDFRKFMVKRLALETVITKVFSLKEDKMTALQKEAMMLNKISGGKPYAESGIITMGN